MLKTHERTRSSGSRQASMSSFDRWLERTQRKGNIGNSGQGHDHLSSYAAYNDNYHVDPRASGLNGAAPYSARPASASPPPSRLEQLEGLLFAQSHYNRLYNSAGEASQMPSGILNGTEVYDQAYPPPQQPFYASHMANSLAQQSPLPLQPGGFPPTQRPLYLPASEIDYSSLPNVNSAESLYSRDAYSYGHVTAGGNGADGRSPVAMLGSGAMTTHEPFASPREPFGSYAMLPGGAEAERYIARLEEEVQALMTESGEKDRVAASSAAARDAMALQLREATRRCDIERDEHRAAQNLTHSFLRTLSFHRLLEERSRAMELNTKISVLQHELKLAETMRRQAELTATSAAAASSTAAQELQRKVEEEQLSRTVTTTVSTLLQQEYARLAELVAQMPQRMQALVQDSRPPQTSPSPPAEPTETPEQRRLYALLESTIETLHNSTNTINAQHAAKEEHPKAPVVETPANALSHADSARLLALVSRMANHQEVVLDLYCSAVETKSSLAQYEMNIIRLIAEKQSSLTWATLYEEKKDEVRHLNEKLMELRGELRLAATGTATTAGMTPRGMTGVGSFAGSFSSQSYETYAAPYVPHKKAAAAATSPHKNGPESRGGNNNAPASTTATITEGRKRVVAHSKPIAELREEARRLGAHPAVHYPLPVTSPSPSMPSLYSSHTPHPVEQTVLKLRSPDRTESRHSTPELREPSPQKTPAVALIRAFSPRTESSSPSTSGSDETEEKEEEKKKSATPVSRKEEPSSRGSPVSKKNDTRALQKVTRTPTRRRSASTSSSSLSEHVSGTAAAVKDRPASPKPASRVVHLNMPALQRVATTASSSSLSSVRSTSVTKPGLAPRETVATTTPAAAAAAASKVKVKSVHNSFDEDDDSDASEKATPAPKQQTTLKAPATAATTKVASSNKAAIAGEKKPTQAAPPIKRLSLDEAVKAMEKAKKGDDDDNDGDTSSLSLSTSSSSSSSPVRAGGGGTAAAATATKTGKAASRLSPAKARHPRKSSFDDDEDSSEEPAPVVGKKTLPSKTITPSPAAAAAPAAASKTTIPALSLAAAAPTKSDPAVITGSATTKKPQKLKLPTW